MLAMAPVQQVGRSPGGGGATDSPPGQTQQARYALFLFPATFFVYVCCLGTGSVNIVRASLHLETLLPQLPECRITRCTITQALPLLSSKNLGFLLWFL